MEETLRSQLSATCAAFVAAADVSRAKVGSLALNDNTFFRRVLDDGQGFTIRIFDRVMQWFSDNWPEGAAWPSDVPRPERAPQAANVSAARPRTEVTGAAA